MKSKRADDDNDSPGLRGLGKIAKVSRASIKLRPEAENMTTNDKCGSHGGVKVAETSFMQV
jgi:hypothetical protein